MRPRWCFLGAITVAALIGCGDQETTDRRGYTKAPLENPGLTIEHADRHDLRQYGRPNLPVAREIQLEEPQTPGN